MPTDSQGAHQLCQWPAPDLWLRGADTRCLQFLICEMGTCMVLCHEDGLAGDLGESEHLRITSDTQCVVHIHYYHWQNSAWNLSLPSSTAVMKPPPPYSSISCNKQLPISACAFQGRANSTGFLLHGSTITVSGLHSVKPHCRSGLCTGVHLVLVFRLQARHRLPMRLPGKQTVPLLWGKGPSSLKVL